MLFSYGYGANVPSTAKRRMQERYSWASDHVGVAGLIM